MNRIVIFGASGLVGGAALRHFDGLADWQVAAISRRPPAFDHGGDFIALDLRDRERCQAVLGELSDTTHVVYAALYEQAEVIRGWRAEEQMQTNLAMLRHALEPLAAAAPGLRHVSLLQGTKAYGAHLRPPPVPAKERRPRHGHENFYWYQEDFIRALQQGQDWTWTVLRPQSVFGFALGAPLNMLLAMAVFALIRRQEGLPLCHPGGPAYVTEATDARLLARAFEWAATAPIAGNQIYNIANGDCLTWPDLWRPVAEHFGMELAEPAEIRLREVMPTKAEVWERIAHQNDLRAIPYGKLVGASWQFTDFNFAAGKSPGPVMVSTVKARQHGFHDCIDTEDMVIELLELYQAEGILPP
ncbi:MAG: SDR family oxidoreductase [Alphaproteobacteria bacterium]|jgi:nucleoside-diphosphate-sugar epimerase|nr:SDR family oxidoreductase [Alphaproteobacteria bacterium]